MCCDETLQTYDVIPSVTHLGGHFISLGGRKQKLDALVQSFSLFLLL